MGRNMAPGMRILVVEDERKMAEVLKRGLEEENHTVSLALDGHAGLELAELYEFDAVILDVMLPGMDGFEVARRLRKNGHRVPILMLTARDATSDIVQGLDSGADDYLNKPFSFEELLARLRATARRGHAVAESHLTLGDLTLNPSTRVVARAGRAIDLTATEFRLLECLIRRSGRVVARDALIEAVWGLTSTVESNTLEAFIRLLRKKIDEPFPRKLIETVRGVGYRIRAAREG
jgi:DNA-binding response OmpR family regulator